MRQCRDCGRLLDPHAWCEPCHATRRRQQYLRRLAMREAFPALDAAVTNKFADARLVPEDVPLLSDADLMAIRNFGRGLLIRVRAAFPAPHPATISNWVGEGAPA